MFNARYSCTHLSISSRETLASLSPRKITFPTISSSPSTVSTSTARSFLRPVTRYARLARVRYIQYKRMTPVLGSTRPIISRGLNFWPGTRACGFCRSHPYPDPLSILRQLDSTCSNIATQVGKSICVSAPGGAYVPATTVAQVSGEVSNLCLLSGADLYYEGTPTALA